MDKSREELEKEYAEATAKLEQYQHRGQRYENRIRYYGAARYCDLLHYGRRSAPLPRTVSRHCQRLPQFFRERR